MTGSAGFVGSHVMERLRGTDNHVVTFDLQDSWNELGPTDAVISLAATADPRQALRNPVSAYENDVRVMVQTMEYARRHGAAVLHVSTNEAIDPKGPYAGGKACQEIICRATDWPATIVVTQSLFGERQQPDKLVPTVIRALLAGEPIPLQRVGDQWASRPFMHVRNLADALLKLVQTENWYLPERVHVGSTRQMSVFQLVTLLAGALNREPIIEPVDAGGRPGHELTATAIGCDLDGWTPSYEAPDALRDVACWYTDNPERLEPPNDALADPDPPHTPPARPARRAA